MIGRTLSNFNITAKLGEGGMGVVWRAEDTELGREVAIKVLPADMAADPERLDRFRREAQSVAALNHPNIVTLHSVAEDEEVHFLVLELIDGQDLDAVVPPSGLGLDEIFEIAVPIADALAAAHEKGITHRDLKPANVMVTAEGRVKVLDFGLVKLAERPEEEQATELATQAGTLLGTMPYMSPEQVQGREVDHRSDIFSFGVVLYEMATGRRPFSGEDSASVISSILRDQPRPLSDLKADLPNHLGRIVRRCLEKDPQRRFQSAVELKIELEELQREIGSAQGVDPEARAWRPAPGEAIPRRPRWVVERKLGEGAFGEVWLAEDVQTGDRRVFKFCFETTRLEALRREITFILLLKEELGQRDDIAGILDWNFDVAPYFIEAEYTEGGDLGQWVEDQGGLETVPLEVRLEIVAQIATALAAAHSVGVLHKDLRPENVLITSDPEGRPRARLTDFGVGAANGRRRRVTSGVGTSRPSKPKASETATRDLSPYMAPEVAQGGARTLQADVYSLGVLCYQMVVGDLSRPLGADWEADVEDKMLREDIAWAVDPSSERRLKNALRIGERLRALEQRRADRADEARQASAAKSWPGRLLPWVAAATGLLAIWAIATGVSDRAPRQALVRSTLLPPTGWDFSPGTPFAVSPDGRQVAYVAIARPGNEAVTSGAFALWVRDLAWTEARVLSPVDGDAFPFWSPDGRWLGFFTGGKLNKIEVEGGPVVPLADASDGRGASWNEDGIILFQRGFSEGLMRVSAAGGTPESVTILDKERVDVAHRWPHFLPDGRHFIFYVVSTTNPVASQHSGLYVGSLDSTETRLLLRGESRALYAREHLLYRVGTTLMAHAFDASGQQLTGEPIPLASGVAGGVVSWGGAQFGSAADVLVHTRGAEAANSLLNWRDREGEILSGFRDDTASFWEPRISHDQTRVAVCVGRAAGDIWIYDLERGGRTRFTFHASDDRTPVWSPDDSRIAFQSTREALGEIWVRPSSGQGDAELLYTANAQIVITDWSSDGRLLFFTRSDPDDASSSVWAFDLESSEARPVVAGSWVEDARLSPDGKWLAYVSDESGRQDVYVQAFPEAAGRWMVSNDGGAGEVHLPAWRGDGQELFYLRGSTLLAVPVASEAAFSFEMPSPLFTLRATSTGAAFEVSEDGQRILANELSPANLRDVGATLVQNWAAALER